MGNLQSVQRESEGMSRSRTTGASEFKQMQRAGVLGLELDLVKLGPGMVDSKEALPKNFPPTACPPWWSGARAKADRGGRPRLRLHGRLVKLRCAGAGGD